MTHMGADGKPIIPTPTSESEVIGAYCALYGHDYEHITTGSGELIALVCYACDSKWKVERE